MGADRAQVVCTAGHVDHGKSALVHALTGTDPDRLPAEQRLGRTIELGFASFTVDGAEIALVDVPGHERFATTMLGGIGPVSAAVLVVGADEGWMPQTVEHLAVVDLLDVRLGVAAITKADLVDDEQLADVVAETRRRLAATTLGDAPVVVTSVRDGRGLAELRRAIGALAVAGPAGDRARLWVDRSFSVHGAGTVVTGTLGGGTLQVGDAVEVSPSRVQARVRSLEVHGRPVDRVEAGGRAAVNLAGVEVAGVPRGSAVLTDGRWRTTAAMDVWVRALPGAGIGVRGAWMLHVGSASVGARVLPLVGGAIGPEGGWARLETDAPLPVAPGDRAVLRDTGRRAVRGGALVVDPDPPSRARGRPARTRRAVALDRRRDLTAARDLGGLAAAHVTERGAARIADVVGAVGAEPVGPTVVRRDGWAVDAACLGRWESAVLAAIAAHHDAQPLSPGAPRHRAIDAVVRGGGPPAVVDAVLNGLIATGRLQAHGSALARPGRGHELDPSDVEARDRLLSVIGATPLGPPRLSTAAAEVGAGSALIEALIAAGDLVVLAEDHAVVASALDGAEETVRRVITAEGPATTARLRDALGTTRRWALPVLGALDARGVTRRHGDVRELA